jgi:hypothetical protein
MIRDDLSTKLVHLIRGETLDEAWGKLAKILTEGQLRGGTGYIRGEYHCVCFTETPISKLGYVLASPDVTTMRYKPLGIMVDKKWLFEQGGRPVIYQPNTDYEKLPEELRYRHVRLELDSQATQVDLTWEREWRVKIETLPLPVDKTTVIVPTRRWRDSLAEIHSDDVRSQVQQIGMDAAPSIMPYPWHIIVLEDLGIPIPDTI